jgi:hypothetical protein
MRTIRSLVILFGLLSFPALNAHAQIRASKIVIIEGKNNSNPERNVVEVFSQRVLKRSDITIEKMDESEVSRKGILDTFDAAILLGQPSHNSLVQQAFVASGVRPPQGDYPGPEGFVIKTIKEGMGGPLGSLPVIISSGVDDRGTIYALTRLMRESRYLADVVEIPNLKIRTRSPGFWRREERLSSFPRGKKGGLSFAFHVRRRNWDFKTHSQFTAGLDSPCSSPFHPSSRCIVALSAARWR